MGPLFQLNIQNLLNTWGGEGATLANAPDLRGYFLRGANPEVTGIDPGRTVGSTQGDAIRNITGELWAKAGYYIGFDGAKTGAFFGKTTTPSGIAQSTGGYVGSSAGFDASRVVPTALENRPHNIAVIYAIKAK